MRLLEAQRAARSSTPPRPTAGSWWRSPISTTRAPLVGDGEQGQGGVLVEHAGLVDQQDVAGKQPAAGPDREVSRVQRPSASHRKPYWWASHAAENACVPSSRAATALPSGSGSPRPAAWSRPGRGGGARVVVLPAPAAPSTTNSPACRHRGQDGLLCVVEPARWTQPSEAGSAARVVSVVVRRPRPRGPVVR